MRVDEEPLFSVALADLNGHPTFESSVVHTPQAGKDITIKYLRSAIYLLNNGTFRYLGEWRAERSAVLEFACEIDGTTVNGST